MILQSFLALTSWQIVIISLVVPVVIVIPIVKIILDKKIDTRNDDNSVLDPLVALTRIAFIFLLAFVISNVWSSQNSEQQVLFDEVNALEDVIIESRVIEPSTTPIIKAKILNYVYSMKANEIDVKPPVGGDKLTEKKFEEVLEEIYQQVRMLEANPIKLAEAQNILEESRQWVTYREERVNMSAATLDKTITILLIFLSLLTIISVALLPANTTRWAKWTQSIGVAITVGLVMSLVFYISSFSFTRAAEDQLILRLEKAVQDSAG